MAGELEAGGAEGGGLDLYVWSDLAPSSASSSAWKNKRPRRRKRRRWES